MSSGALTLDIALGGGFPKGRIIEVRAALSFFCTTYFPPAPAVSLCLLRVRKAQLRRDLTCCEAANQFLCKADRARTVVTA